MIHSHWIGVHLGPETNIAGLELTDLVCALSNYEWDVTFHISISNSSDYGRWLYSNLSFKLKLKQQQVSSSLLSYPLNCHSFVGLGWL